MQQPLPLSTPVTLWKRNRKKVLLFLLGFVFAFVSTQAQTIYPVQSTTRILPPYSVYLADYAVNGNDKLQCLLVNRDATATTYQVRLRLTVKLNGRVIMQTSPSFNPAPIALTPNSIQLFAGSTLEPYLKSENLEFLGYSQELYEQNRALPEGFYEICFAAFDYFRQDVQVSNDGCGFYFLAKNEPPLINGPACGNKIQPQYSTPIRFSWLPRNTASINSNNSTLYRLFIYEVNPRGTNPNDIVNSLPPIYVDSTNINQTYYDLLPTTTLFRDSMEYVWRVQAVDINGSDLFRNNGYSQVCTFTWGGPGANPFGAIDSVLNLNAIGETERKGKMWWTKDLTKYDSYKVHYKKSGSGYNWFTSETENDTLRVFDLEPDTEYECRIQGRKNGSYGIYSEVRYFRTKKIIPKNCDDESLTAIATSGRPMLNLLKGTTITYRDFEISVTDFINNGNGWYKGSGIVSIPFLAGLNFAVEFDNIQIDDAGVVSQGEVRFVSNDLQDWINKKIKAENGGDDVGDVKSGDDAVDKNVDYDISDPTKIKVLGPVVNGVQQPITNGVADLIITKPDGTTDTLKAVTLPYTIKDKDGDIYSIGKDGKVVKVGKSGAMPGLNPATLNKVQLDKAKVTFKAHPSQQYAFDAWQSTFAGKPIIADEYEKLTDSATNTVYYVPNKAIGAAKTDKVIAKIEITDNSIIADSIKFVTAKGTQFESNKTSTANEYEVQLVGGPGGDAQELFAVYKKADGTLMTLGKLKVSAYGRIQKQVILVPVQDDITDISSIQKYLNDLYGKVNIEVLIRTESKFSDESWDITKDGMLDVSGSGLFSQYTSEMKALNRSFASKRYVDKNKLYLFVMKKPSGSDEIGGDMPRGSQFGYLFTDVLGGKVGRTIAHELGHGTFNLKHTFDETIGLPKGSTQNIMDYSNDHVAVPELYKYQWDQIHDPGIVDKILESDANALSVTLGASYLLDFKNTGDDNYTFITPSGKYISLPKDIQSVKFSTLDRLVYTKNQRPTEDLLPLGSLMGFTDKNGVTYSVFVEGTTFMGYLKNGTADQYYKDIISPSYGQGLTSGIALFVGVQAGKFVNYISRFPSIATDTRLDDKGTGEGALLKELSIISLLPEDMDKTISEVLTAKKVHNKLNTHNDVAIYLNNGDVIFDYLFSQKTLEQFLLEVITENSKLKDYLGYFTFANLKKNEVQAFATCLASEFQLNDINVRTAISVALSKAQFGQSGRLTESKHMLSNIKGATLEELIGLVNVDMTVVNSLKSAVLAQASASVIHDIIRDHYVPCAFGAIDFDTRKYILNKLLGTGYNNDDWYTHPTTNPFGDDGSFILKPLIASTPLFDQAKLLKEGFMVNNYAWLRKLWTEANTDFNGVSYEHVVEVLNIINVWVKTHYKDLEIPITKKTEVVYDLGSLQFFDYPAGSNDYYLGMKNSENYRIPNSNYSLSVTPYGEPSDVTFQSDGLIRFKQNYYIEDVSPIVYATGSTPPVRKNWVDYDETLNPFEPLNVIVADNYGELDFTQGDGYTIPAYMAMVYNRSMKRSDRDHRLRLVGDGIMIGVAALLAPETGGGSLAAVTNFVTRVGGITASLDMAIETERHSLTPQQLTNNKDFYTAWDEFKTTVDYANIGVGVANVTAGLYAKFSTFNAIKNWNKFTSVCRNNLSRMSTTAVNTWNRIINISKVGDDILDIPSLRNLLENTPSGTYLTNISKEIFNTRGLRISKPQTGRIKEILEDIMVNGDRAGTKTEEIVDILMDAKGFQKVSVRYNEVNGLDGFYFPKGQTIDNATEFFITESKQFKQGVLDEFDEIAQTNYDKTSGLRLNGPNEATGLPTQMSNDWIRHVINNVKLSNPTLGGKLEIQWLTNRTKFSKFVNAVDKANGDIFFLKLDINNF
jgi:hypothetical protein